MFYSKAIFIHLFYRASTRQSIMIRRCVGFQGANLDCAFWKPKQSIDWFENGSPNREVWLHEMRSKRRSQVGNYLEYLLEFIKFSHSWMWTWMMMKPWLIRKVFPNFLNAFWSFCCFERVWTAEIDWDSSHWCHIEIPHEVTQPCWLLSIQSS